MDHPFSRGLPDFVGNFPLRPSISSSSSLYRPQSSSYPRYDPPRSRHPPTPPLASPSLTVPDPFSIRSDPVRKITPPEQKEITAEDEPRTRDKKLAKVKEYKTPYDKAYACVQEFRAWRKGGSIGNYFLEDDGEPQVIKMPMKDWAKLSSELDLEESDDPYPRLSYNAFTETLIIQCMPSPVHQSIGTTVTRQFISSTTNLPEDLQDQTVLMAEQDCERFGGEWAGSGRKPDLAIQVRNADEELEIKFVLEAGLSESYDQLVEDAQLWLGGMLEVSMVVLVKFVEVPAYHSPLKEDKDPQEFGIPLDLQAIRMKYVTLQGEYGPATYQGLTWVGEINEVYLEIWVRNENGEAVRQGDRVDLKQAAQVQLDMGGFLPPGYPRTLTLNLNRFRSLLKLKIKELAADRCGKYVKRHLRWRKRQDDGDRDGNGNGNGDSDGGDDDSNGSNDDSDSEYQP